jgi:hypothetical protein
MKLTVKTGALSFLAKLACSRNPTYSVMCGFRGAGHEGQVAYQLGTLDVKREVSTERARWRCSQCAAPSRPIASG